MQQDDKGDGNGFAVVNPYDSLGTHGVFEKYPSLFVRCQVYKYLQAIVRYGTESLFGNVSGD